MTRRSPSPEGVGDLLKHDSFNGFEDEGNADHDNPMTGAAETPAEEDDEFNVTLDEQGNGDEMKDSEPLNVPDNDSKLRGGRQPIPHFPTSSAERVTGLGNARYFIIKSNNHSNIEQSLKYGIWATQKHNEDKFAEAYRSGTTVIFVFSVNMSGHFQGYAKMAGLPFKHKQDLWGGGAAVSNSFDVEWVRRYDLAFRDLEHIRNPLNEDKPIKISRDGQELPPSLGQIVCQLFDQGAESKGVAPPPVADRNHSFNIGPAVGGYTSFGRGGGGRGGIRGPQPPRGPPPSHQDGLPMGMVMTPMGPMPAQMAMQMGMGGMMGPGMDFPAPMMGPMGMSNPMMGMGMDQMAAMQAMMGGRVPGMMNMPGGLPGPRGPVPPPKPPPPRSPPKETDVMKQMMENAFRSSRGGQMGRSREEELLMRALELGRRGTSPSRDRRRYRSRSRSPSPRRYKSHRRSRSRSRSRSTGRHRDKMADMSYDDYLVAFDALKRARKEKDESLDFAGGMSNGVNPMMAQMANMMGGSSKSSRPASGNQFSGMMNRQAGASSNSSAAVGNMTEDEYVRVWESYSKSMGTAFDAATVRGWYRSHKQMSGMKK